MNDLQMQMMSLARHQRILAREQAKQAAATPQPQQDFAAAVEQVAPAPGPATPAAAPAPDATRVMNIPPIAPAATAKAAAPMPSLSADQAALLAASMGATLPETATPPPAATPAATSTAEMSPEMSEDQMAALMSGFGKAAPAPTADTAPQSEDDTLPQTAAAMAATAIPQAQDDNLRYFPLNSQAAAARQMTASDTYLRAMQQMEVNLGAYGGLKRNGR